MSSELTQLFEGNRNIHGGRIYESEEENICSILVTRWSGVGMTKGPDGVIDLLVLIELGRPGVAVSVEALLGVVRQQDVHP